MRTAGSIAPHAADIEHAWQRVCSRRGCSRVGRLYDLRLTALIDWSSPAGRHHSRSLIRCLASCALAQGILSSGFDLGNGVIRHAAFFLRLPGSFIRDPLLFRRQTFLSLCYVLRALNVVACHAHHNRQ